TAAPPDGQARPVTARRGEPFDPDRARAELETRLTGPLPASGPAVAEGEPVTGEWTATRGEGFLIVPLWEGDSLTGVYGPEWNAAEEAAEARLRSLVARLDARWGAHRRVSMRVPLLRPDAPLPELLRALAALDCYGDLTVWGPVPVPPPAGPRWAAVSLNQSDADAPMILVGVVSDRPVTEPEERD
ncbi:hypothetical protein, partial [Streptomyces sp. SID7958]|uniref:hypothetical protein n=1 Tax=Streptomyces sp. SID7958 TaxID=2706093 RepID=UPI0031BBC525